MKIKERYTYIDGDNIGLKIEVCFLENNEESLLQINKDVKQIIEQITDYLIIEKQEVIFSGADGIICKGENFDIIGTQAFIRGVSKEITFSIGSGLSLMDSYIALRYAKSLNKNIAVELVQSRFTVFK